MLSSSGCISVLPKAPTPIQNVNCLGSQLVPTSRSDCVEPPLRPLLNRHRAEDVAARAATEAGVVLGAQFLQRHKLLGPALGANDGHTHRHHLTFSADSSVVRVQQFSQVFGIPLHDARPRKDHRWPVRTLHAVHIVVIGRIDIAAAPWT